MSYKILQIIDVEEVQVGRFIYEFMVSPVSESLGRCSSASRGVLLTKLRKIAERAHRRFSASASPPKELYLALATQDIYPFDKQVVHD